MPGMGLRPSGYQPARFGCRQPVQEVATQDRFPAPPLSGNHEHAARAAALLALKEGFERPVGAGLGMAVQVETGREIDPAPADPALASAISRRRGSGPASWRMPARGRGRAGLIGLSRRRIGARTAGGRV